MQNNKGPTGPILVHLCPKVQSLFQQRETVPIEVKAALQECQDMHDLLDLLFSTDFYRDEAFQGLFEQRIQELDASNSKQSFFTF
jgi:hypothetical protein